MLKRNQNSEGVLLRVPTDSIRANPYQPRTVFDEGALASLATSIRRYGVLQPISVRRDGKEYELIAGERRLRAAILAGKREIPAIVYAVGREESAELSVMENLLREDLNVFETAEAIKRLIDEFSLTQEEIASRLSVSQSYVANKLRLLRFNGSVRARILAASLSERHARALLRLPAEAWEKTLATVTEKHLNVAQTERLVEELLSGGGKRSGAKKAKMRGVCTDLRLFYNSVDRAVSIMRRTGVKIESKREESESEIRLVISIPVCERKKRGA